MMKTGILTFHRENNYGAVLQTFALQKVLKNIGVEPEIINYIRSRSGASVFSPGLTYKNCIINVFTLLKYRKAKRKFDAFNQFRCHFLNQSENSLHSLDELKDKGAEYKAIICGSDQIWQNLGDTDQSRAYYLDFVDKNETKKISYAPSFGASTITDEFKQFIKPLIDNIPYLSIREETGKNIISETTGRNAKVVLDPTLLLNSEEWLEMSVQSDVKKPYILCYSLSQRKEIRDLVSHVRKKLKLPVVVISTSALNLIPADYVLYDVGPKEFVSIFANATCVCSNSFHGTAFSIINRKPFWTTPHRASNSRIADLLDRIELSDRQINCNDNLPEHPLFIDYSTAEQRLDEAREESIEFLKNALFSE